MYAIIKTGGKQYKAEESDTLIIEKIEGEAGTKITFDEVLAVFNGDKVTLGSPNVKGATVQGEIVRQGKAAKINAYNYKAKKNERKRWGHRQPETHVKIVSVTAGK